MTKFKYNSQKKNLAGKCNVHTLLNNNKKQEKKHRRSIFYHLFESLNRRLKVSWFNWNQSFKFIQPLVIMVSWKHFILNKYSFTRSYPWFFMRRRLNIFSTVSLLLSAKENSKSAQRLFLVDWKQNWIAVENHRWNEHKHYWYWYCQMKNGFKAWRMHILFYVLFHTLRMSILCAKNGFWISFQLI